MLDVYELHYIEHAIHLFLGNTSNNLVSRMVHTAIACMIKVHSTTTIFNPLPAELFWGNIISVHWDDEGSSSWRAMIRLSYIIDSVAADVLVTQGAKASAAMVLT